MRVGERGRTEEVDGGAQYVTGDEVSAEFAGLKVDLIKWMVGTGLGVAAVTTILAGIILRALQ
ncbi:MAG: hypothetical protein OXU81_09305 [Gammaproteobacteria bacterium]|nr:hypothetical protein [Gammaproteobacteria bacterium]